MKLVVILLIKLLIEWIKLLMTRNFWWNDIVYEMNWIKIEIIWKSCASHYIISNGDNDDINLNSQGADRKWINVQCIRED